VAGMCGGVAHGPWSRRGGEDEVGRGDGWERGGDWVLGERKTGPMHI